MVSKGHLLSYRIGIYFVLACFCVTSLNLPCALAQGSPYMPKPGTRVALSPYFSASTMTGMVIHPDNALRFDFLIKRGDEHLTQTQKQDEYMKLVKYFMASLTVADNDQWVNLSPYEKDRIVEKNFGNTQMGRDLLAQDYLLKQISASLMYPEEGLGKEFWKRVYGRAKNEYGVTNVPVNTINKVWIVPEKADIFEKGQTVVILNSRLNVMLEEDYLAVEKTKDQRPKTKDLKTKRQPGDMFPTEQQNVSPGRLPTFQPLKTQATQGKNVVRTPLTQNIMRDIILPELNKEVNEGKNFAPLRQIYSAMILSTWFKKALKESLLGKVYSDQGKIAGVDLNDPKANEQIYQQYLLAFKKGAFNYIKEDVDQISGQKIPKKYFSGGFGDKARLRVLIEGQRRGGIGYSPTRQSQAMTAVTQKSDAVTVDLSPAMTTQEAIKRLDHQIDMIQLLVKNGILQQGLLDKIRTEAEPIKSQGQVDKIIPFIDGIRTRIKDLVESLNRERPREDPPVLARNAINLFNPGNGPVVASHDSWLRIGPIRGRMSPRLIEGHKWGRGGEPFIRRFSPHKESPNAAMTTAISGPAPAFDQDGMERYLRSMGGKLKEVVIVLRKERGDGSINISFYPQDLYFSGDYRYLGIASKVIAVSFEGPDTIYMRTDKGTYYRFSKTEQTVSGDVNINDIPKADYQRLGIVEKIDWGWLARHPRQVAARCIAAASVYGLLIVGVFQGIKAFSRYNQQFKEAHEGARNILSKAFPLTEYNTKNMLYRSMLSMFYGRAPRDIQEYKKAVRSRLDSVSDIRGGDEYMMAFFLLGASLQYRNENAFGFITPDEMRFIEIGRNHEQGPTAFWAIYKKFFLASGPSVVDLRRLASSSLPVASIAHDVLVDMAQDEETLLNIERTLNSVDPWADIAVALNPFFDQLATPQGKLLAVRYLTTRMMREINNRNGKNYSPLTIALINLGIYFQPEEMRINSPSLQSDATAFQWGTVQQLIEQIKRRIAQELKINLDDLNLGSLGEKGFQVPSSIDDTATLLAGNNAIPPRIVTQDIIDQALNKGGIDLNSALLDMTIKRDGQGVPLPLAKQDWKALMSIPGFVPVIIEIKPASSLLPLFSDR